MTRPLPCVAATDHPRRDIRHRRRLPRAAACWRVCVAGWLGSLLLALVLAPASARAAELVIATIPTPLSMLVHVADVQGLFAAEGVKVRISGCSNGKVCIGQLFDKTAQMATVSELGVVLNSFVRNDYAMVATIGRTTQDIKLIGRRSAGIRTPADLRGKRIGVNKASGSQYFLDACLLFYGLDPRDVEVVFANGTDAPRLFADKQVDAFAVYVERMSPILKALGSDAVVLEDPRIYTSTINLVVDRATLANRRGDVVKVLRALERARIFMNAEPAQVKAVSSARMADPAMTEQVMRTADYRLGLEQSLLSTMAGEARWALREGHVDKASKLPDVLRYVEPAPLREAVPAAVPW